MTYRGFFGSFLCEQFHKSGNVYFHFLCYLGYEVGALEQYFMLCGLDESRESGKGLVSDVIIFMFSGQKHTHGFPVKQNWKFLQILLHVLNVVQSYTKLKNTNEKNHKSNLKLFHLIKVYYCI